MPAKRINNIGDPLGFIAVPRRRLATRKNMSTSDINEVYAVVRNVVRTPAYVWIFGLLAVCRR